MKDLRTNLVACCVLLVGCMVPRPGAGGSDESETSSGGADGSSGDAGSLGGSMTSSSNGESDHDTDGGDPSAPGSSTGSEPDESSGAMEQPCEGTCAMVFEGWHGPLVAHRGDGSATPTPCDGDFGKEFLTAPTTLSADPAQCECSCGAAEGTSCGDGVTVHRYSGNCVALQATYVAGANCTDIPNVTSDASWRFESPTPAGGACDPSTDVSYPAPRFLDTVRLCEAEAAPEGACGEGQCVPTPTPEQGGLCYWAAGEFECPIGERTLLFGGTYEDQRACGACECGEPTGACVFADDIVGAAFDSGTCGGLDLVAYFDADTCTSVTANVSALMAELPTPDVSCAPSGGEPLGDVVPTGVTTMCCIE